MSAARAGGRIHRLFTRAGWFAVRRPWWTVAGWLLVTVAVAGSVLVFGSAVDDDTTLPGTAAQHGRDLLDEHFPGAGGANGTVILRSAGGPLDPALTAAAADRISGLDHVTSVTPPSVGAGSLTADGGTGYLAVQFDVSPRDISEELIGEVLAAAEPAADTVFPGGTLARGEADTRRSEALGIGVALVVLIVAFGGLVAAGLPLLTALLTLVCGLGVIGLAGHLTAIPAVATTVATMIGLGVGIDYALFMITRYRTLLTDGVPIPEAIVATVVSSGSAVAFAGGTVIVALAGLAVAGVPILATLGWTAGLIVLIAVASSITLLPALLALLGPRVNALRLRRQPPAPPPPVTTPAPASTPTSASTPVFDSAPAPTSASASAAATDTGRGSAWGNLADRVTRRPWPWALVSVALLLVVAAPVTAMTLGQTDAGDDPPGTAARAGYDVMAEEFGAGATGPIIVVAELSPAIPAPAAGSTATTPTGGTITPPPPSATVSSATGTGATAPSMPASSSATAPPAADGKTLVDARVEALSAAVAAVPGVVRVQPAQVSADGSAVSVRVIPADSPGDPGAVATVRGLEQVSVPGVRVFVTGATAAKAALAERVGDRMPYVIGLVVVLAALLVLAAFRAPVVAVKAAVMNLFSVAAAYGVLTAVFQWGWGVTLLGLDGPVPIESYVPMLLFALLFGLSMDYEVFLLTAVRESWDATGDNRRSVREGLAGTGMVITSAALIMGCVFASFVLDTSPIVKMTGLGLAVAVAIDATVIRGVLVPATMALMGRANWWTPRFSRR
ncbi:MMPL family transporter [Actinoplanes derwentensis]|uniref:Putative drug exporter of the RND superfamily n=1 Tax=Actinoplanes derwentensis TaxID=113562 RepID=A0A1H2ANL5_9ACTN|nr:MMPL family transporter [Actinoplanes derwentensis]GID89269.1 hypothetical protein Ade03nite_81930 [Actinoplanes derwentensis]SDT47530.1 putative drug exporter of the RND superfamily [Actinoplanes derwentensis]